MDKYSYLSNAELTVIEDYYNKFKENPESVDTGWKKFFEGYEFSLETYKRNGKPTLDYSSEFKVVNLITGYRQRGHLFTKTNPVRRRRQYSPTLDIGNFGLTKEDLQKRFDAGSIIGIGNATLQEIIEHLQATYCRSIGVEYLYIRGPEIIKWLQSKMEPTRNLPVFSTEKKLHILNKLNQAVVFEEFLHTKFVGQKTFSLQGAESLIPALDYIIISGSQLGIEEFVIGMAHRGRLNVLTNILNQPYEEIFSEFMDLDYDDPDLLGDVKYHLGYSNNIKTPDNKDVHLTVVANPSHLEAVDPVTEGIARARIDKAYNKDYNKLAAILIHGDSSIAGQGVVYETLQLSQLEGYKTGGTIHIVINNQLGFTTNYLDARSSTYCTDVAKTVLSPVFHVNGDDPEALVYTIQLAMEFRQTFHRDIFIDLLCYRKWGHNEADEPRFTQPLLYKIIEKHPNPRDIYIDELLSQQVIDKAYADKLIKDFKKLLDDKLTEAKLVKKAMINSFISSENLVGSSETQESNIEKSQQPISYKSTAVDREELMKIAKVLTEAPAGYKFFDKALKILKARKDMIDKGAGLDWALCELLAIGTLLYEGYPVRMSGQDIRRGTFSQRHSTLTIEDSEEEYIPLKHINKEQANFEIYNSPLSEYGVLGFEYGYSLSSISHLVIWEAQFGDFDNVGQTIIDQYIVSAEEKWNLSDNIVMFLPHGYEAQGPDHSSARLERFLILCAANNIIVANCSTPANLFHLLRRHKLNRIGKPMVVFTPKSLLRHLSCVSTIEELTKGEFKEVIDNSTLKPEEVSRVVLCSGKIYYEISDEIKKNNIIDTAIVRLEQMYPFPLEQLKLVKEKYKAAKQWIWAQEEPENMGALQFIKKNIKSIPVNFVGRPEAGSPAPGSKNRFVLQQEKLMDRIFNRCPCDKDVFECKMVCAEKSSINSKL